MTIGEGKGGKVRQSHLHDVTTYCIVLGLVRAKPMLRGLLLAVFFALTISYLLVEGYEL